MTNEINNYIFHTIWGNKVKIELQGDDINIIQDNILIKTKSLKQMIEDYNNELILKLIHPSTSLQQYINCTLVRIINEQNQI